MPTKPAAKTAATRQPVEERPRAVLFEALNKQAGIIRSQAATIRRQSALLEATAVRQSITERQLAVIAQAAGVEREMAAIAQPGIARFAALMKEADERNPAQPIPQPASEAPTVTTEEARGADGMDDPTNMGASPVTDVSPDAVTDVTQPYGTQAFEPLNLNEVDVTAPVAGTETMRPPQETITEVEVRVGNPDNPVPAFPWAIGQPYSGPSVGQGQAQASKADPTARSFGSLRLARLRIQAGIAETNDDLSLGQTIASSDMSDGAILAEINTLSAVAKAASRGTQTAPGASRTASRSLVPRVANREPGERSAPSMANTPVQNEGFEPRVASMSPEDEEFLFS